jgi:hypothetical protein
LVTYRQGRFNPKFKINDKTQRMKKSTILRVFILILVIANIVYYLGQWGGDTVLQYVSDSLPVICSFIGIVCLFRAYKGFQQRDFAKISWLLILVGVVFFFIAETIYGYLEVVKKEDMNEYFPSIADYFWCAGYVPMLAGLIMMFTGYKKSGLPIGNPKLYLGLSIGIFILALALIYYLLVPIVNDAETNLLSKIFYLFYPIADLLLVIPAALLMYITSLFGAGTISRPWKFLAFGYFLITIADLLYAYLGWQDLYGNGNLIDVMWHAGYLVIGLAGLYQRELIESIHKG